MKKYIKMFAAIAPADTYTVISIKLLSALFFSVETLVIAALVNSIMENISVRGGNGSTSFLVIAVAAIWCTERLLIYLENAFNARLKKTSEQYIEKQLIEKKDAIPYSVFADTGTQELLKRVSNNTTEKFNSYFENSVYLLGIAFKTIGLLSLLMYKSFLAGIVLLLLVVLYVFLSTRSGEDNYDAFEESEEQFRRADYYMSVINDRKYASERLLFRFGEYFGKKWSAKFDSAMKIEMGAILKLLCRIEIGNMVSTSVVGLITAVLVVTLIKGYITVGFLIAFVKSTISFIDSVSKTLSKRVSSYVEGKRFYQDYESFERISLQEPDYSKKNTISNVISIEFQNVSFSYPNQKRKILNELSFRLDNRYHYALVGENGCGKSTILKLLMGFYDDYTGDILINDINIRKLSKDNLRKLFSYVPQEITRYDLRLDEYLGSEKTERKKELFDILELSINSGDSNPLLGKIEKDGVDLSGGQWQLLAIARAMLDNRQIYILDEPTAAIDPVREAYVYGVFNNMIRQQFALLITHRLGAARMADKIIVLRGGRVQEMGSHEELLDRKGIYYRMFETQKQWYMVTEEAMLCETT
jgi:ATP-binding cassette subfamily B protein